ncbi:MAG: undecaprenyldiphospho-muramoylpentapeptide beta-N-acetylglucosaminyltransferase [Chitinophagales bacterium]
MKTRFIISGGGTGGHIFPAVAIANALRKRVDGCEILFVGANGRMEMEKVPNAGYKIRGLNIAGFQRTAIWKNWSLPFKIISSEWDAIKILKSFKPHAAIGVGGYASGPLLFGATLCGIPTLIQEQNSFAGVTNRILSRFAKKICVAYSGMDRVFPKEKVILTGNPVRAEILQNKVNRSEALHYFGLSESVKTIFVSGGSLGARTLNESVDAFLNESGHENVQIIWQTGKTWQKADRKLPQVRQLVFIEKMEMAYAAADVIISRAGALSVSELQNIGKPVILVPSPNVTDDHQTHNAMALVHRQAAILVKDAEAKLKLMNTALALLQDDKQTAALSANIAAMAISNAAERIVDEILSL